MKETWAHAANVTSSHDRDYFIEALRQRKAMKPTDAQIFEHEHRILIAVAESCWRQRDPSHSWHVLDWICWKLRCKYPLVRKQDQIYNWDIS